MNIATFVAAAVAVAAANETTAYVMGNVFNLASILCR